MAAYVWCENRNCKRGISGGRSLVRTDHSADFCSAECHSACEKRQAKPKPTPQPTTVASAMRELAELRGGYDFDRRMADIIANVANVALGQKPPVSRNQG